MGHTYNLRTTTRQNQKGMVITRMVPNEKVCTSRLTHDARNNVHSSLLNLPLELRIKIWQYAMNTDTLDTETNSPVYIIKERRALRDSSHEQRKNRFALVNATSKSLALKQTCRQICSEIQAYNIKPSFQFTRISLFCAFLGHNSRYNEEIDDSRVKLLASASKVIVNVHERERQTILFSLVPLMIRTPFAVSFVDEKGDAGCELRRAVKLWRIVEEMA